MTSLSVIIPCYNCERTLEEAATSVYRQDSPVPFDVTMVDDGSTDGTYGVMRRLAAEHPNVKLVRHATNLGGGAARNAAVAHSRGELIFCLDSDDMMGEGLLRNLADFWLGKRCDGLGISTSIKFKRSNLNDVAYVTTFSRPGETIPFEALLDGSDCSLMSTFLITREAFAQTGGYPTEHGFDTQGMAWRFLANGLTAFTCPDAVYHHRVEFHRSYYIREDQARRYNWNWLMILNEFLYLFNDETKDLILGHEPVPAEAVAGLDSLLRATMAKHPIFASNYTDLIEMGRDRVAELLDGSSNRFDQFWMGEYWLSRRAPGKALGHFRAALDAQFSHPIIHWRMMEAAMKMSGSVQPATFVYPRMCIRAGIDGLAFEATAPAISAYQRFENWLMRYRRTRLVGTALKRTRLQFRRPHHSA